MEGTPFAEGRSEELYPSPSFFREKQEAMARDGDECLPGSVFKTTCYQSDNKNGVSVQSCLDGKKY
jgi:hypothetical protein